MTDLKFWAFLAISLAKQEPGDAEEIKSFCSLTYNVSFPMFKKIDVNGKDAHELYEFLKAEMPGLMGSKAIKWNFTKFFYQKRWFRFEKVRSHGHS